MIRIRNGIRRDHINNQQQQQQQEKIKELRIHNYTRVNYQTYPTKFKKRNENKIQDSNLSTVIELIYNIYSKINKDQQTTHYSTRMIYDTSSLP